MAQLCFVGDHINPDVVNFQSAYLVFSSLNAWFGIDGLNYLDQQEKSVTVRYEVPPLTTFYKNGELTISITYTGTWPLYSPIGEFTIKQKPSILIDYLPGFTIDTLWNYESIISSFLTLAYFSDAHLDAIKLIKDDKEIICYYSGQDDFVKPIGHWSRFLFTYNDIKPDFEKIFKKWTTIMPLVEPTIFILTESLDSNSKAGENKFLNIVQAIETFHRRMRKNEKLTKELHKQRIAEILVDCPDSHKEWLKGRLHFSNEPTLQERFTELFEELDNRIVERLFFNSEELIRNVKNTRNYLTHYDTTLESKAVQRPELFYLTERLQILLLLLILNELEIGQDKIYEFILRGSNRLFNHLIHRKL
jgi:hypothetical protein